MGIGSAETLQQAFIRQSGGDGHAVLKYITDEQFDAVKNHPSIDEIAYDRLLADELSNKEFLKRRTEFWYYDDVSLKFGYAEHLFCPDGGKAIPDLILDRFLHPALMWMPIKTNYKTVIKITAIYQEASVHTSGSVIVVIYRENFQL